jgi:glycosyltransferase involved in cell wall biosynthesis
MNQTVQPGQSSSEPVRTPAGDPPHVVIAHDWLVGLRGGEHVLDAMIRSLVASGARVSTLVTMFDEGRPLTPAIDALPRLVSPLGRLGPLSVVARRHLLPFYPWAVGRLARSLARLHQARPIDLLVSTSSAAIKGLESPRGVPHLSYIHSPPRYLWSQTDAYSRDSLSRRLGLSLMGPALRRWDVATASRPSMLMANSAHTKALIAQAWGRESEVVHPGVRVEFFSQAPASTRDGSWLVVSALEPYKRLDVAIEAARLANAKLVIVGEGSQRASLERLANGRVEFTGRLSDQALRDRYAKASILLHPQLEDFGIVAVEAQAAGLAVVAFDRGGAAETVLDGVTGVLVNEQSASAFAQAANRVPRSCDAACREHAASFSESRFHREFIACVRRVLLQPA